MNDKYVKIKSRAHFLFQANYCLFFRRKVFIIFSTKDKHKQPSNVLLCTTIKGKKFLSLFIGNYAFILLVQTPGGQITLKCLTFLV